MRTTLLLALVIVLLATGGVAATLLARGVLAEPTTPLCEGASAKGRVGVSDGTDLLDMSDDDLERTLRAAHDAGVWAVRVDVDWSHVEAERGRQDWSRVDRVVHAVRALGMCAHGLLAYAPAWAADPAERPVGSYFAPRPETFATFARATATRYRDEVSVWEIWNEPNTIRFFKPRPDAATYGALLAAAHDAIKAVSPDLTVVSGGLAPAEDNGSDIAPTTFLKGLYRAGANRYFDAFGIHPYTYPALPNDLSTSSWNTALRLRDMHDTMVDGGDPLKRVWITECGAPTGTAKVAVSDAVQADSIRIMLRAARDVAWLGPAFVYSLRDSGTDVSDPEQNFGILRHDLSPKPSYAVVRSFASGAG
ncbi:cellulase family glycosylhydrolase [Mycolicibacterium madagascariense]|uniref:cellulase family glycosylhydrolase n=1 Tax=Mycolicibacterium madagascariense TaxID=212765 RepID=UPI001FE9EAAC|nr:cellulase family glycosylhydrolase [Mycolicibacterium madagascariense]